jgi:hypothetical protein
MKIDLLGDTVWTRQYGGEFNERAISVSTTFDGGYIIVGETYSFGAGWSDVYILRIDSLGDTVCTKTYGGRMNDNANSILNLFDGYFLIAGTTESMSLGAQVYLLKINSVGDTLWTRSFGDECFTGAQSVTKAGDDGYYITGTYTPFGSENVDVLLMKIDTQGNLLWTKLFGGESRDVGYSVASTADGGCIIAGVTDSYDAGRGDIYIIRVNSLGDTLWTRVFGSVFYDEAYSIIAATDGIYVVAGNTSSISKSDRDYLIMKINTKGEIVFIKTYGAPALWENAYCIAQAPDGGYVMAGSTYGQGDYIYVVKTDPDGNL